MIQCSIIVSKLDAEERSERILFQNNKVLKTQNWMFGKERVSQPMVRNTSNVAD